MKKKKVVKIILYLVLVLGLVFFGHVVRNVVILKKIEAKQVLWNDEDEHYEKIINASAGTVLEYYCKGDKALLTLIVTAPETGETRKITRYFDGEKENSYFEMPEKKMAYLNQTDGVLSKVMLIKYSFEDNLGLLLQMAATSFIQTEEWNGKPCYMLNSPLVGKTYFEKQTGLIVKMYQGVQVIENGEEKPIVVEYEYEFGSVPDEKLVEPDVSQYEVQE